MGQNPEINAIARKMDLNIIISPYPLKCSHGKSRAVFKNWNVNISTMQYLNQPNTNEPKNPEKCSHTPVKIAFCGVACHTLSPHFEAAPSKLYPNTTPDSSRHVTYSEGH